MLRSVIAAWLLAPIASFAADAPVIGVSWGAEPEVIRWQIDESALRARLDAHGVSYRFLSSGADPGKQVADISALLNDGVKALLILPHNARELAPVITRARESGIPVVAYDRDIPARGVFYVSFDNRQVGRLQAVGLLRRKPRGSYAMILGDPEDMNTAELYAGYMDILRPAIERGDINVVAKLSIEDWQSASAKAATRQLLQAAHAPIVAMLVANDGLAGGVIAALREARQTDVAVSGQDGELDAIRRVAEGTQTLTVFKDSRTLARIAADTIHALQSGETPLSLVDAVKWKGAEAARYQHAILLHGTVIDRANLAWLFAHGYATREEICASLRPSVTPEPCW